ncbi:hypothetical protein BP5796_05841 [Coleophoma crateriformis]|uniref:Rhodopsin domain-containing protein n=1 Tax=Coleophoma crateriformis TaxID=565419 RepID=A0A3D8RV87_9HELO|nr:hypothetical protein BP5796_05841 [Coleophoma crateriformis]
MLLERLVEDAYALDNRLVAFRITNIAVVGVAALFVVLRYLARWRQGSQIGADDYVITAALLLLFGNLATSMLMMHYGLGLHASALSKEVLKKISVKLFAFEGIYLVTGLFTKISVLLLYLRLFPLPQMRKASWTIACFTGIWMIPMVLLYLLQCRPISRFWDPSVTGHCLNIKIGFIVYAIPSTLIDAAILIVPISQIWQLRISFGQRLQVSFIFLLGSCVIFTSIYRFITILRINPDDLPWTAIVACTWCIVESSAGIISACLPTLAPLVRRINFHPWRPRIAMTTSNPKDSSQLTIGSKRYSHRVSADELAMRRESVVTGMESVPKVDPKYTTHRIDLERGPIKEVELYPPVSHTEEVDISEGFGSNVRR